MTQRPKPQVGKFLAWALTLTILIAAVPLMRGKAQETLDAPATDPKPGEGVASAREIEPVDNPTFVERIDRGLAATVKGLQAVLFYPLAARERTFVEFAPTYYYRVRGSEGDFQPLQGDSDPLSDAEYKALEALGKLTEPLKMGRLEGQDVEYFAYQLRSGTYVLDGGVYRKDTGSRQKLSDEEVLTPDKVVDLAAQGQLKTDPDQPQPHILTEQHGGIPLVVLWLSLGAVIFTFYMGFYNFRGFTHALQIVRGRYDNPNEPGEVTHLQALSSALSATVGLGNIAGVTIAMSAGGPGAFFWMLCCGFFGMTSKFVESTLGQKYRKVNPDGTVRGGPMEYLKDGFAERGMAPIGAVAAFLFTVMCIMASFGGGNMFQANQAGVQMLELFQSGDRQQLASLNGQIEDAFEADDQQQLSVLQDERTALKEKMDGFQSWFLPAFGVTFAVAAGLVIIGGIKRIGAAAEKVVPTMCGVYILACLYVIAINIGQVPGLVAQIFQEAFTPQAFGGGFLGVFVIGVQRAAFSNEAGVGSAAIAHSAAKTDEPVREGTVALLGPFIDTIVVCSMTALVILITGAWQNDTGEFAGLSGSALTSAAFASIIPWFRYVLTVSVVLFAYSTLISWSYYGEKCWETLFGPRSILGYKLLFLVAVFVGTVSNMKSVLDFSDMMIFSMAFPNILGLLLLSPSVRRDLKDYWRRYKAGEFKTYK